MADMKNLNEFENKIASNGVYYSRIIASWSKVANRRPAPVKTRRVLYGPDFEDWLETLGLTDQEVKEIRYLADNGKLELEESAGRFLKNRNNR